MKKVIVLLLVVSLIIGCFTGCGKDQSQTTEELMEKYSEPVDEKIQVWLYNSGTDFIAEWYQDIESSFNYYNLNAGENTKFHVTVFHHTDLNKEQFQKKLQAALMSADGPDLVLSHDPELFSNVEKLIDAHALRSFDSIISEWEDSLYYPQVIEGVRSEDGQVYILPISYNPDVIVTTQENLDQFDLTKDDFENLDETLDSLTAVWQQLSDKPDVVAEWSVYYMTRYIPAILQNNQGKTEVLTESVQANYEKLMQMITYRQDHSMPTGFQELERIAGGTQLFAITPLNQAVDYLKTIGEEERAQYVFIPMRNTVGEMSGSVGLYALLPKMGEHEQSIASYLYMMLFSDKEIEYLPADQLWLTPRCMKWNLINLDAITKLSESDMRLRLYNQIEDEFNFRILGLVEQNASESDWAELERSINIYLSE